MLEQLDQYIESDMELSGNRTQDLLCCCKSHWAETFYEPLDENELLLFLCDEHRGCFAERQRVFLQDCREEIYNRYRKAAFSSLTAKALQPKRSSPVYLRV